MTARERAFAAELRGETPVRRYAPGEPVAFLPMEALNGDVGRVAREVALETGYRRAPLASLRSRRGVPYRPAASRPAGTEDMDWFGNKRSGNGINTLAGKKSFQNSTFSPDTDTQLNPSNSDIGTPLDSAANAADNGFSQSDPNAFIDQNQAFDTNRQDFAEPNGMIGEDERNSRLLNSTLNEDLKKRKGEILKANRKKGREFEIKRFNLFKNSYKNVVEQITIQPYGSKRKIRVDAIGIDPETNQIVIQEYKSSLKAPFTKNQRAEFNNLFAYGGVVRGKGKGMFGKNFQIAPGAKIEVIRPDTISIIKGGDM